MPARLNLSAAFAALICCASLEPVSAQTLTPRPVEQSALARDVFETGVLARSEGALPSDLWRGARAATVAKLLDALPARPQAPSLGEALRRTLLTPGDGPQQGAAALGGKKLLALVQAGYAEEARTIASLSNAGRGDPAVNHALAVADLLDGQLNDACLRNAALASGRDSTFWVTLRVLCYAAKGERDAAELTLGLLREQGALSETDDRLLSAVATGAPPKSVPAPLNAVHLAALRQLKLALAPGDLKQAEAGVLVAVMNDASVDASTRTAAAMRAARYGAVSAGELAALYAALPAAPADIANAEVRAAARPNDPYSDVLVYRKIASMAAPELLRDKAGKVASAIGSADSFERLRAAALVYGREIKSYEGTILAPSEYARFALARLAAGDASGAAFWIDAMQPQPGAAPLGEPDAMEMIDLVGLLSVLDPAAAARVAARANVEIADPMDRAPVRLGPIAASMPDYLEAAFDATFVGSKGQAALVALATSSDSPSDDAVARVVIAQSLRAAGLDELRRAVELESAIALRFVSKTPLSPVASAAPAALQKVSAPAVTPAPAAAKPTAAATRPAAKPAPRIKPKTQR